MSVKYKKAYDWLEEDDAGDYIDPNNPPPSEITLGSGKQLAYEQEIFVKLRDAFEGITDGNKFGKGTPVDNHPIPKAAKERFRKQLSSNLLNDSAFSPNTSMYIAGSK
jgi:hypothetical protein